MFQYDISANQKRWVKKFYNDMFVLTTLTINLNPAHNKELSNTVRVAGLL
jgi:hypothetical protein